MHSEIFNSTKFIKSVAYLQDDSTWCVRRAAALARWKNVFYIIQDATTYFLSVFLIILAIILTFLLTSFEERPTDFIGCALLVVQIVTGITSNFQPKGFILRILTVNFLFMCFLIVQIINAFLVSHISRVLYGKQIDTIAAILEEKFHFVGEAYIFNQLSTNKKVNILIIIRSNL